jgi:predicted GNAT family acetyltransferase
LTEVPATDFIEPNGVFIILQENGETVAGGALRRYDPLTAEVKRVWTSHRHRRRGLARRVMAELEAAATELGYQRIHLTTGPRQPEARNLYLAAGYTPRFDPAADPETIGPLAFAKELVPGAGLADLEQPAARKIRQPDIKQAHRRRVQQQPLPVPSLEERRQVHTKLVNGVSR